MTPPFITVLGAKLPLFSEHGVVARWRGRHPENNTLVVVHRYTPTDTQIALDRAVKWTVSTKLVSGRDNPRRRFRYEIEAHGSSLEEAERNAVDSQNWLIKELAGKRW